MPIMSMPTRSPVTRSAVAAVTVVVLVYVASGCRGDDIAGTEPFPSQLMPSDIVSSGVSVPSTLSPSPTVSTSSKRYRSTRVPGNATGPYRVLRVVDSDPPRGLSRP